MIDRPSNPADSDLHAFVDDQLDDDRRAEVETWLADNPDARSLVDEYKAQSAALHDLFDPILDELTPAGLIATPRKYRPSVAASLAAAFVLFLFGGGLGWFAHDIAPGNPQGQATIAPLEVAEWALTAHVLYSPEVRHPVEVEATEQAHLVAWLTKRLGGEVRTPRLAEIGYSLIGGRLLPSPGGPAAQFMYQNTEGGRVTLYISSGSHGNRETAFRFIKEGPVSAFYWIDGDFGYALVGEIAKDDLLRGARLIYEQLTL